ncbi:MAG: 4Fe-4S dicluster domain-containing protein [Desulfovibrio sp.]|uniref:4Fe-4S dicluster domain-containing protein n=1 Tax=Desulfovibrio sp. 7SRBS1 TaxID=3378064 RepID=UPI003B3D7BC3
MDKNSFIELIKAAGIVGEGGAGFPAHVKYNADVDTIIANGCECEPLLHTDHFIMKNDASRIGRAMQALGQAVGASRLLLAIKKKHSDIIPALGTELSGYGVDLFLMEDFYPAGDEQILVREVTGRSVPPLGIPLAVSTIVANVGTLAHVGAALEGKSQDGKPAPITDKILTITGEVGTPGVVRAPLGTSMVDCLEKCGGALPASPVFIIGGPMMGRVVEGLDGLASETVTKTTGGLIVLPAGHYLHRNATLPLEVVRRRAASACIQCRACSDICPRGLIGHPLQTHTIMRAFAAGNELSEAGAKAMICSECGACEHYACPMGMAPRRINQAIKRELRAQSIAYEGSKEIVEEKTAFRDYRKIPVPRLAGRIGISHYMSLETPFKGDITPAEVNISLRQHIGAPSQPVVAVGDTVAKGDLIGAIPEKALGAQIHASVGGKVLEVGSHVRIAVQ